MENRYFYTMNDILVKYNKLSPDIQKEVNDFLDFMLSKYKDKKMFDIKSWKNKIKVFLMPPDWENEDVPLVKPDFEVDENGKRKKYKLDIPFRLGLYIFTNVVFTMAALCCFSIA